MNKSLNSPKESGKKGAAEVKKKSTTEGINAKLNIPEVF